MSEKIALKDLEADRPYLFKCFMNEKEYYGRPGVVQKYYELQGMPDTTLVEVVPCAKFSELNLEYKPNDQQPTIPTNKTPRRIGRA